MTADIINTDYIYKHKFFHVWRTLVLIYALSLVVITAINGVEYLLKYNAIITTCSIVIVTSLMLSLLVNSILFSRIGTLSIEKDTVTISTEETTTILDLTTIKNIEFGKSDRRFYYLKIKAHELIIELNDSQLSSFNTTLKTYNINIQHHHFTDRLSHWFNTKRSKLNTKNY